VILTACASAANGVTLNGTKLFVVQVYTIEEIKARVEELALKINAPASLLPVYAKPAWDAHPFIEVGKPGFMCYVISERGHEYERKMTDNMEDLLYWVFADVTFSMACEFEVKNREEDKDCRRIIFARQEELLGLLNESWKQKEKAEHGGILIRYPFDDTASLRARYLGQLKKQGYSDEEIEKLLYERYPAS
jgi:hypothetical protein